MEAGLRWRKWVFLFAGVPIAMLVFVASSLTRLFDHEPYPAGLAFGLWAVALVDTVVLTAILFGPKAIDKFRAGLIRDDRTLSLDEVGRDLSLRAVPMMVSPMLMGLVLLLIGGRAWDLYIFVPISAAAASYLWRRIETILNELQLTLPPTGTR